MQQRLDEFQNLTLLFADASEGAHRLMPLLLEGCVSGRLFLCRNAAAIEDTLEREAFDLVIVNGDSGTEGSATVRALRSRADVNRTAPVLFLTSKASRDTIFGALLAGAHSVLRKPFCRRDLACHLHRLLTEPRIFVPFGKVSIPLTEPMARQLGPAPDQAAIIAALRASVYERVLPGDAAEPEPAANDPSAEQFAWI
jgi:CheY-like chemotaxis protein